MTTIDDHEQAQVGEADLGNAGGRVWVVVPTRNEAQNVGPLLERLSEAFSSDRADVLFVDDSDDDTPRRVEASAAMDPHVHLLHRGRADRAGGLGSAVLAGFRRAAMAGADWVVVMDGDLQHPPEVAPELISLGRRSDADVVVASRYTGAGSAGGLDGASRAFVSSGATRLSRAAFPWRLRACSDPMSGFFAVRLAALDLDRLRPQGFKILLEVLVRSRRLRVAEQPFTFAERHSGESKASWREGMVFLGRLLSLRLSALLGGRGSRLAGFAAVGASGILVNSAALWLLVTAGNVALLAGALAATQVSTTWNYLLTDLVVFRGSKARPWWQRYLGFALVNNAVLLLRLPLLAWLVTGLGLHYLMANLVTLVAAFAARFVTSDLYLFASRKDMTITTRTPVPAETTVAGDPGCSEQPRRERIRNGPTEVVVDVRAHGLPPARVRDTELAWQYDIHGLLTLGSVTRLRELDAFQVTHPGPFDIEIRRGAFHRRPLRGRARVTQYAAVPAVSYEEHLGRYGSDFLIEMGESIRVTVGPLLVASPHVLYTNVVEALLRFVLVSRGHVLLHSACLDMGGRGLLLSARTDTGKTGTVLRLLREGACRFLSDDMTILGPDGSALSFPKPLTISQHTLRAVDAGELTRSEWRWLMVQSRLHSKQGRGVGARLGEWNLPIMSLNAVTQYLVPPPKYTVQRLVPCDDAVGVPVEELYIIERGAHRLEDIDDADLVDELIDNTDDAYGFPPFRYFAPALEIDGQGYDELRARERRILQAAMSSVRARRLATPDFSWAPQIARLAAEPSASPLGIPPVPK